MGGAGFPAPSAHRQKLTKWRNDHNSELGASQATRSVHMAHVDAILVSWSNIGITVRIPKSAKLTPGNNYYVGISAQGDSRWLSNISQTFRLERRR